MTFKFGRAVNTEKPDVKFEFVSKNRKNKQVKQGEYTVDQGNKPF